MMGEIDFRVGYENGAGAGVYIREKFPKVVCRNLNTWERLKGMHRRIPLSKQ